MKENEAKKIYNKKITQLKNYNKFYFEKSEPLITDNEYDQLKKEILELEKKYKYLKNKKSPSVSVGFTPSKNFKKKNIVFLCYLFQIHLIEKI